MIGSEPRNFAHAIVPQRRPRGQRAGMPCRKFDAAARARCPPYGFEIEAQGRVAHMPAGMFLRIAALAAMFVAQPASAQTVLFEGARVIPGDGRPAIENAAL